MVWSLDPHPHHCLLLSNTVESIYNNQSNTDNKKKENNKKQNQSQSKPLLKQNQQIQQNKKPKPFKTNAKTKANKTHKHRISPPGPGRGLGSLAALEVLYLQELLGLVGALRSLGMGGFYVFFSKGYFLGFSNVF